MSTFFRVAAIAGIVFGARRFRRFLNQREKSSQQARRLAVWEGEGGAVPVEPTRTAAQIAPRNAPPLSPRGVG